MSNTMSKDEKATLEAKIERLTDAVKAEFEFYEWYNTAPAPDIVRNVMRRRAEMQELCRKALQDKEVTA
jgi:hypothetical protein